MQRNCTWCRETEAQVKLFFMKTLVLRDFVRTSFHTEGTDRLGLPKFFSGGGKEEETLPGHFRKPAQLWDHAQTN